MRTATSPGPVPTGGRRSNTSRARMAARLSTARIAANTAGGIEVPWDCYQRPEGGGTSRESTGPHTLTANGLQATAEPAGAETRVISRGHLGDKPDRRKSKNNL